MMTTSTNDSVDERPAVWIGHAGPLVVPELAPAIAFYEKLGLRWIHGNDELAALQLRGGTHLVLVAGETSGLGEASREAPFDLMVDDLESLWGRADATGLDPTSIEQARAHARFEVTDPGGNRIRIHDSHVVGLA